MDGVLKDGRSGKLWMCKREGGHVLGLAVRVSNGNAGVKLDKLLLFRHAVDAGFLDKAVPLGYVEAGEAFECDICASKRTWGLGEAALERFMRKRNIRSSEIKDVIHE